MTAELCAKYIEYAAVGLLFGVPIGLNFSSVFIFAEISFTIGLLLLSFWVLPILKNSIHDKFKIVFAELPFITIFLLFLIVGSWRAFIATRTTNQYAALFGSHRQFVANVISEPLLKNNYLTLEMRGVGKSQKILATVRTAEDPRLGQRVVISGTLHAANLVIGNFDYGAYLRAKGIYATVAYPHLYQLGSSPASLELSAEKIANNAKSFLYRRIFSNYDQASASLLKAVLFGDTSGITPTQEQQFIRTGSIHLIAVSGFKLTIILLVLQQLLRPFFGPKYTFFITILVSLVYLTAFDFNPAIVRAACMSWLYLIGQWQGGGYDAQKSLLLCAAIMAFINPLMVTADASFLFSVIGVFGIITLIPKFQNSERLQKFLKITIPFNSLRLLFYAATAAYLATLPLSLYFYGELSLIGPLTALFIMPLFEPCIVLGFSSALPFAVVFAASLNEIILRYFSFIIPLFSAFPFAAVAVQISGRTTYFIYVFAAVGLLFFELLKKHRKFGTLVQLQH
jgi:competence protein ComEC